MNHIVELDALHAFLDGEIDRATKEIQQKVSQDDLKFDSIVRLAAQINTFKLVKGKFYKERDITMPYMSC